MYNTNTIGCPMRCPYYRRPIRRRHLFLLLASPVLLLLFVRALARLAHAFAATQCFSRVVPATPLHGLRAVPEVAHADFTQSAFRSQFQRPGVPLVVRGFAREWPAMARWADVAYFGDMCGHAPIASGDMSFRDYCRELARLERDTPAVEFGAMTDLGRDYYFSHNEELFYHCPALWEDVRGFRIARAHASKPTTMLARLARLLIVQFEVLFLPADFVWGDWVQAVVWIGPPGSTTKLHYDDDPLSLLVQIKGSKRIRIYSPDQSRLLYPQSTCPNLEEYGTRFSRFDGDPTAMTLVERERFPNLTAAQFLDVEIHPGDMIFIPSGWWHFVTVSPGSSTSVSVASRSYSTCEGLSYLPSFVANWLHSLDLVDMRGFCIKPTYFNFNLLDDV